MRHAMGDADGGSVSDGMSDAMRLQRTTLRLLLLLGLELNEQFAHALNTGSACLLASTWSSGNKLVDLDPALTALERGLHIRAEILLIGAIRFLLLRQRRLTIRVKLVDLILRASQQSLLISLSLRSTVAQNLRTLLLPLPDNHDSSGGSKSDGESCSESTAEERRQRQQQAARHHSAADPHTQQRRGSTREQPRSSTREQRIRSSSGGEAAEETQTGNRSGDDS